MTVLSCIDDDKAYGGGRVVGRTSSMRHTGYPVILLSYFGVPTFCRSKILTVPFTVEVVNE